MKKLLLSVLTLATCVANAQLPSNDFAQYEFLQGSLVNTSTSGASNLTGSLTTTTDRFGGTGNAATPSSSMSGANLGSNNLNNSTLCFWVKRSSLSTNVRILQMYGTGGNGYRVEMDGTNIHLNGSVESSVGNTGGTFPSPQGNGSGLDDDAWHHIAVRTKGVNANTSIQIELFVDGSPAILNGSLQQYWTPGGTITNFLQNATLVIDPLNGAYGGNIDDIYLYRADLTNTEIVQIYNYPMSVEPIVNIPDVNFKAYLVGNSAINTNSDAEIQVSEASAFTGQIDCGTMGISDMTGLEAFTSVTDLRCHSNSLSDLDVFSNTALSILGCAYNSIEELDITNNMALTVLNCGGNSLSELDVSILPSLNSLKVFDNSLLTLNVANGNNSNFVAFEANGNSGLTCIEVDDAVYSDANWTNISAGMSFSENCASVNISEQSLTFNFYPNPTSNEVTILTKDVVELVKIYSLTGQEAATFTSNNFSVENLANGIYTVKVTAAGKTGIQRLVKQ